VKKGYLVILALGILLTACNVQKKDVSSVDSQAATEVTSSVSDSKNSVTPIIKDDIANEEKDNMLAADNNQEESKTIADNSEGIAKEAELANEAEETDTTQSDLEENYQIYRIINPDEVEYFGETPTFIISKNEYGIQITLDFVGSDTYAMYEAEDTSFTAMPEVVSFSMGEDGMGVPSDNNSTMELTVNGDEASIIFHYPEGEQSDPVLFERIE
jgi:hypothetical protein